MTPLGFFGHGVRDGGSSLSRFPLSKLKLDNFFLLWLAAPDSQKLVRVPTQLSQQQTTWDRLALACINGACSFFQCCVQVLSLLENAKLGHTLPGPAGSFNSLPSLGLALSQVA
jgi:hypothetical protein